MRFRRKSVDPTPDQSRQADAAGAEVDAEAASDAPRGPFDSADAPGDLAEHFDLGGLLLPTMAEREIQLQVDESSGTVRSVMVLGQDGALELVPFAAPRHGGLWEDAREDLAAQASQRGGTVDRREGEHGTELMIRIPMQAPDGRAGFQPSRVVGIAGPRWLLRATFLGRPAMEPDECADWDEVLSRVVVHRGSDAMAPGDPLPLKLPQQAMPQPGGLESPGTGPVVGEP